MRIPRIYHPGELSVGARIVLEAQQAQHVARVLRLVADDQLIIFNGKGGEYSGKIIAVSKSKVEVEITEYIDVNRESPACIHLGQGISRGDRMDYAIQKAVELGVSRITPLFTERCEVKLSGARLQKRVAHWQAVAHSACEQSGRCLIPSITPPVALAAWLQQSHQLGLVCDTTATQRLNREQLLDKTVSLLIGPEGGLSANELQLAQQLGFQSISLGPRILRTETAAVVALSLVQVIVGDLFSDKPDGNN